MDNFEINTNLKNKPKFKKKLWLEMKESVLGKKYDLSLVFVGDKMSKNLNKQYRNKDKVANILSFEVTDDMGEIFINFPNAKKESKKWEKENGQKRSVENFIDFLFIHGLSHLKGLDHQNEKDSEEMESFENKIRKKFDI